MWEGDEDVIRLYFMRKRISFQNQNKTERFRTDVYLCDSGGAERNGGRRNHNQNTLYKIK